jgi:Predicted phosphohydrolases
MRTIVHLSDLHFGAINEHAIGALIEAVGALRPDVVAVSGDLTQRARAREFTRARAFLGELPSPQIVVPGNHDVPFHNVVARFCFQLSRYRRYITPDLEPFLMVGDDLAIAGLNTARSWTFKGGRVNEEQVTRVCEGSAPHPPTPRGSSSPIIRSICRQVSAIASWWAGHTWQWRCLRAAAPTCS